MVAALGLTLRGRPWYNGSLSHVGARFGFRRTARSPEICARDLERQGEQPRKAVNVGEAAYHPPCGRPV